MTWIVICQLLPGYLASQRTHICICEVVSYLTKSGVGWDTICSRDGGCQMIGSEPTGKVTGLTNRTGWAPKCSIPIEVEGFDIPCILLLKWAATVLDLILFLGGCSSNGKVRDLGQAVLFDFFSPTVSWGVRFSVVSNESEDDFTSDWVGIMGITGGGENNHLPSLRNAWGEVGVSLVGCLIHLPGVPQVCPVKEAQVGEDHSP